MNPNQPGMNYMTPNIQSQSASNSFYQGPVPMDYNYLNQNVYNNGTVNDYDNRLAKLERSINRLDARITKLENKAQITTEDITNNNLYMV